MIAPIKELAPQVNHCCPKNRVRSNIPSHPLFKTLTLPHFFITFKFQLQLAANSTQFASRYTEIE